MHTAADLTRYYSRRIEEGAGPVTISASVFYLGRVLKVAREFWHLDVPLEPVQEAKSALALVGKAGRSNERDRRVEPDEIARLCGYFRAKQRAWIPMADIIEFVVGSSFRLGEICRIRWDDYQTDKRVVTGGVDQKPTRGSTSDCLR